jgi:chlorite dismutase
VGVAFFLRVDVRDGHTAKKDLWITRRLASVCAIVCVVTIEIGQLDVSVKFSAAILRAQHRLAYIFLFPLIKHETSYTYPQYFTAVCEAGAGPAEERLK